jgi:hypothetical protein
MNDRPRIVIEFAVVDIAEACLLLHTAARLAKLGKAVERMLRERGELHDQIALDAADGLRALIDVAACMAKAGDEGAAALPADAPGSDDVH